MPQIYAKNKTGRRGVLFGVQARSCVVAVSVGEQMTTLAARLEAAAASILRDANRFHDKAQAALDDLEVFGREPEITDDWLDDLIEPDPTYYFDPTSLITPEPVEPRQVSPRERANVIAQVEAAIEEATVNPLSVAHAESPSDWQGRIEKAMAGQSGPISFGDLAKLTRLSGGALMLGLLLTNWLIVRVLTAPIVEL